MGCCYNQHQSDDAFMGLCCLKIAISATQLQKGPFLLSLLTSYTIASIVLKFSTELKFLDVRRLCHAQASLQSM